MTVTVQVLRLPLWTAVPPSVVQIEGGFWPPGRPESSIDLGSSGAASAFLGAAPPANGIVHRELTLVAIGGLSNGNRPRSIVLGADSVLYPEGSWYPRRHKGLRDRAAARASPA
ncbi:hypothetical protein GCM10010399_78170 [Dactylosporangium fulvum]